MSTQWRIGMAGAIGLDYNALPVVMTLTGIPENERPGVFEDLRVMESAALKAMEKSNE